MMYSLPAVTLMVSLILTLTADKLAVGRGLSCVCSLSECENVNESDCPNGAGTVWDSCRCCRICARVENEPCGGPFGFSGSCAAGLECVVLDFSDLNAVGVCTRIFDEDITCHNPKIFSGCNIVQSSCRCEHSKSCSENSPFSFKTRQECQMNLEVMLARKSAEGDDFDENADDTVNDEENDVKCNNSNGCESSCPPDSKIGSDGKCVCSYDKCPLSPANCNEGYVKKRVHESTEIPGECCSIDDCVKEIYKNCSAVTCPELEPCPSDSYRLPALTSVDGCCVMNQKCICLPTCHPKNCTADTTPVIEVQSTGEPGQCCPLYKCVKTVEDMTDEATTENSPQYCTDNGSGILNPNQILKHGANYTSAEKCSFCVCQNGDLTCSMPSCKPCIESVKLPNECCPRCTIPTEVGSHCPPMPNCTKPCPYGNELDANKCITCECKECPTECVYFDPSGIKQCDCNHSTSLSTSSQCPPLLDCNNHCEFGFKKDEKGCDVCKCTECHKQCSDGYMIDNKGVSICKCQPWLGISTKKPEAIENSVSCKTDMNVIRDDGETWFDGCRECTCISGKEMCSLVHCSPLTCSNPILNVTSSCCPFCADDPVKNKEMSHMVCSGLNGGLMLDGEIFILNECIQCVCREGRALCLSKECPPAPCSRPRQPNKGECCSTCSLSNEVEADFTSFMSDDRCNQLHNSTVWRKDSCTSCRCVDSEARCFTELCESLSSCQRPLVIKGRCCPICIDEAEKYKLDDVCVHENTTYKSGNEWKLDSCRKCKCVSGHIECTEMVCPQVCMDTIHQPGKCCPVCADNPKFSFLQQISYTILLVVIIFISVMLVICLTKHWRYRKQQIHLRDFGCSPPQYHQYKVISSCPYDTTTSQKMLSSEKTSLAPV